jgi:hypothetical protein
MRRASLLRLSLPLALAFAVAHRPPAAPVETRWSCSDCISVCLLEACGFVQDPQCVNDNYGSCQAGCAADGSC